MLSPRTARHARLYRLANKLARQKTPGAPTAEADKLLWVNSHVQRDADRRLSAEEERLRQPLMPLGVTEGSLATHGQESYGNLFHFRDFPMFPGEHVPAQHNAMSSLRSELSADLAAQSLKAAWMRVSGGRFFASSADYYSRAEGADDQQLGDVVNALFPALSAVEATALVRKFLEALSKPDSTAARRLSRSITAEAVGLDKSPGHYTNFMEWMGRMTDTKAFKTEHCIFQFCRRKFNHYDVRVMNENYRLMSAETLQRERSDSYSHFHAVLKDFSIKVNSTDSRHQIGVRIDPAEVDLRTGCSFGAGRQDYFKATAVLRENRDHTGSITVDGRPLHVALRDASWDMEQVLMPFDEAALDAADFDLSLITEGRRAPDYDPAVTVPALRMATAQAISKMLPITRIPLKKSGVLSMDRTREVGEHPGFLDGKLKRRRFFKR